jgi:hypothetical protein
MLNYDFDPNIQKFFYNAFSDFKHIDWEKWLDITSIEEYEELALKNSGLSSVEDIKEKVRREKSSSTILTIDLNRYIVKNQKSNPPILCHSSGTTNSNLNELKWFHMSNDVVQKQWAPGMQAIFESSGLNSSSSVVIFVPSRMKFDGIQFTDEYKYISLYSSEFSQRVMLSVIHPKSYFLHQYRSSKSLISIAEILSMEDISVISAPAATILGWADINKLKEGIKNSPKKIEGNNPTLENLIKIVNKEDLTSATKIIQEKLSEKLSSATLVFSISSLSENDWSLIRKFMKWERGDERYTNLYVVSEIGPFAASLTKEDFEISRLNKMYVFPLTVPVVESKRKRDLLSRSKEKTGNLLVSRLHRSKPIINIDLGDVVTITNQDNLPLIEGNIRRSCFELRYPIKITDELNIHSNYSIFAGDYFNLKDFEIIEPRHIINCFNKKLPLKNDSILLLDEGQFERKLFLAPISNGGYDTIRKTIIDCTKDSGLADVIRQEIIKVITIKNPPVDFMIPRIEILEKVRKGLLPKGILKKWPLYLLRIRK